MDERTARDAARVRARGALAGTVLCGLLALGCAVLAATSPAQARALLWTGAALAVLSALACVRVVVANRSLEREPRDPRPRAGLSLLVVGAVGAWLVAVLVVAAVTRDLAWTLASVGLLPLVLPPVVLALVTAKGPHPA